MCDLQGDTRKPFIEKVGSKDSVSVNQEIAMKHNVKFTILGENGKSDVAFEVAKTAKSLGDLRCRKVPWCGFQRTTLMGTRLVGRNLTQSWSNIRGTKRGDVKPSTLHVPQGLSDDYLGFLQTLHQRLESKLNTLTSLMRVVCGGFTAEATILQAAFNMDIWRDRKGQLVRQILVTKRGR